mmetsp:Transcript_42563/g.110863  ORF Transcript_42563/g.110863 Transcript_42563/m.110863 type:complete len:227 (+) Transcript_42563:471-1151(+)
MACVEPSICATRSEMCPSSPLLLCRPLLSTSSCFAAVATLSFVFSKSRCMCAASLAALRLSCSIWSCFSAALSTTSHSAWCFPSSPRSCSSVLLSSAADWSSLEWRPLAKLVLWPMLSWASATAWLVCFRARCALSSSTDIFEWAPCRLSKLSRRVWLPRWSPWMEASWASEACLRNSTSFFRPSTAGCSLFHCAFQPSSLPPSSFSRASMSLMVCWTAPIEWLPF